MVLSWEDIVLRSQQRQADRGPFIEKMRVVAQHYNGEWVIPVPGIENTWDEPLGPALITEAVDTVSLRAASLFPEIIAPALDPSKNLGVRSLDYARRRKLACEDTWRRAEELLVLGKTFRHLVAYASTAMIVEPDWDERRPMIRVLDPLTVYPEWRADTDFTRQRSVAFIYRRTGQQLINLYPQAEQYVTTDPFMLEAGWDIVEWYDDDQITLGCLGMDWSSYHYGQIAQSWAPNRNKGLPFHISTRPNRLGKCPVVTAGQVSLTKAYARLAGFSSQVEMMARMTALVLRAAERAVFPDRYVVGKDGEQPMIIGGTWKEGTSGEVNLLTNVATVGELRGTPDPIGMQMVDRMERNMRVSTGQSSILSGEQSTNALRTGRAIDSLMGASMDPRIAELQRVSAVATRHVNSLILEHYRTLWPSRTVTLTGFNRASRELVEMTPKIHIETVETEARYPFAGSDLDAATIRVGQLVGTEMISRSTGRRLHPMVEDAGQEEHLILQEKLEAGLLAAYMQQAADPAAGVPLADQARVAELVGQGVTLVDAINQTHREAQARQATMAPAPQPGQVAAPEAMPGMGMPGQGQEQPQPTMQGVASPLQDFKSLVQAARVPYGGRNGALG